MSQCEGELFNLRPLFHSSVEKNVMKRADVCHTLITDGVCLALSVGLCACVCVCFLYAQLCCIGVIRGHSSESTLLL